MSRENFSIGVQTPQYIKLMISNFITLLFFKNHFIVLRGETVWVIRKLPVALTKTLRLHSREADGEVPLQDGGLSVEAFYALGPSIYISVHLPPPSRLPAPQACVLTSQLTSKKGGRTTLAKRGHSRL